MAKNSKVAEYSVAAVKIWLKQGIEHADMDSDQKKVLAAAVEMIAVSAEYIVECAEKKSAPSKEGAALFVSKKLLVFASLSESQQMQCMVSLVDTGFEFMSTGTTAVAAVGTGGVATPVLLLKALSLLVSVIDTVAACKPVVKKYLRDMERAEKIRQLYRRADLLYRLDEWQRQRQRGQRVA